MNDIIKDDEAIFEELQGEKTPEGEEIKKEKVEKNDEDDESKVRRSEIAQKKHWREKAQNASSKVAELTAELDRLKEAVKKPQDDKEAAAQDYIREQVRKTFSELQEEKAKQDATQLADFEDKIQTILDDNPDISEEELLDAIETYEVEPSTALKIIQKQSKEKVKKPKMPKGGQGSVSEDKEKPDDSKKTIWQIAQDEIKKTKS